MRFYIVHLWKCLFTQVGKPTSKYRDQTMGGSPGQLSEELRWSNVRVVEWAMTWVKRRKGWRMICDVGEVTESLENTAKLILQSSSHFTHVTAYSPTLPSLYLHHSSFCNPSVASPTSQFILQPFFRFSYVTSSSRNSPGESPQKKPLWRASIPGIY